MASSWCHENVQKTKNALIRAVFQRAGDTRKVLCVALDYAKRKHVALICDGNGDILKSAFPVENNPAGIDFLIKEISATARRRKIPKNQIFFGGENEAAVKYASKTCRAVKHAAHILSEIRKTTLPTKLYRDLKLCKMGRISL
jgi:orotidine-5'-phosphate decarboxylase